MNPAQSVRRLAPAAARASVRRNWIWRALLVLLAFAVGGCSFWPYRRAVPQPGRTTLTSPRVVLPAQKIGNFLLVETKWDRFGPYRFLIDTGSSVTLITPTLARRYPAGGVPYAQAPRVRVTGADGRSTELPQGTLPRLELGAARFEDVPVLIYDCEALSAHLGVRIDGILGFPLFRDVLLTLDYPGSQVVLQPTRHPPAIPGTVIPLNGGRKTPLIPVRLGERTLYALIDSGSDLAFSLNPVGVEPQFEFGPRIGATIGTLAGDRTQRIGRLAETMVVAGQAFVRPVVDVSDELSAIGGGVLRHFTVTFDQSRERVTFHRGADEPIPTGTLRSAGVSFSKTPAYWRVAGVVPDSSADRAGIQLGDLVTRINGEPVARWDLRRYEQWVATADHLVLTFLHGSTEREKRVEVFDLVP